VKIGFTVGDPKERAKELSTHTGIPEPFYLVGSIATAWPREVEAEAHRQLDNLRVSKGREFFKADQCSSRHLVSDDELNRYFMLIITQAAEAVDIQKRQEALYSEYRFMSARHVREVHEFMSGCMKKNSPEDYEQMVERFRQAAESEGGHGVQD
jgi:hypothetical protein